MKPSYKKTIAIILILSFSVVLLPKPTKAGSWGESIQAALLKETLEELYIKIKETVVANLKIMAVRIIQGRLQTLLTGSPGKYGFGGNTKFITNWREQIFVSAENKATVVVNNYFSKLKSGTGTIGKKIVSSAEKTLSTDPSEASPTIDKYVPEGKVSNIFKSSTPSPWKAWMATTDVRNLSAFYTSTGSAVYGTEYSKTSSEEALKGVAYRGYKATTSGGSSSSGLIGYGSEGDEGNDETITTPGSLTADITSEIQNMGTKILTMARSIPEIVSSMVTQMITQMINQGLTKITQPIDNQLESFRSQVGGSVNQAQEAIQSGIKNIDE